MLAPSRSRSPPSTPPEKRGTIPVTTPSRVDLPTPVGPGDEHQLALVDDEVDVVEDPAAVVPEGDAAQLDHAATILGGGAITAAASPRQGAEQRERGDGGDLGQRRVRQQRALAPHPPARRPGRDPGQRDAGLGPAPRVGAAVVRSARRPALRRPAPASSRPRTTIGRAR